MIDAELERFTADEAEKAGLVEALKRGETIVEGHYCIAKDGYLELKQRNFTFTDKSGVLRVGRFVDNYQLMEFCRKI